MLARTHDLAAFTALGVAFLLRSETPFTLATAVIAVTANLIGGITPDIDQPTAPLWRNLPILKFMGRLFDRLSGGHRFITHSIIGLVVFGFLANKLLLFLQPIMPNVDIGLVWWAFMIGMVSHLVMDSLTKEGVPWLLPIPIKFGFPPIKRLRITTGKKYEAYVVFPGFVLFNMLLYWANYDHIVRLFKQYLIS